MMLPPRRTALWLALLLPLLLWCADPAPAISPSEESPYLDDLAALFTELDENYPFFATKGVEKEWAARKKSLAKRTKRCRTDEEFAAIVVEVVEGLRDSHARITAMRASPPKQNFAWPGVSLAPGPKGTALVVGTFGNLKSALPVGTVVTRIEGKPAGRWLERRTQESWLAGTSSSSPQRERYWQYRQAFSGERGSTTEIRYLDGRKEKKLKLVANQELSNVWARNYHLPEGLVSEGESIAHADLGDGVGYVWVLKMKDDLEKGMRVALAAHPDVTMWVVDLRANTGGGYSNSFSEVCTGLGKKVAGIIDGGTISAGETFARDLAEDQSARLFGETTSGASSTKQEFTLPSGFATIRYSIGTRRGLRGKSIEFHGIEPHEVVTPDPADLFAGKNTEIERAKAWLLTGK